MMGVVHNCTHRSVREVMREEVHTAQGKSSHPGCAHGRFQNPRLLPGCPHSGSAPVLSSPHLPMRRPYLVQLNVGPSVFLLAFLGDFFLGPVRAAHVH